MPPLHSAPPLGGPRRNIVIPFGMEKLECWGYPMVKTNFEDMYNCLHIIPHVTDRQTDGQTDRQTDGQTNILPWYSPRYAYASRGKH